MHLRTRRSYPFSWRTGPHMGRFPSVPPGFAHSHVNQTHTGLARGIPLGAWLDLHSLGSLQVTNSQYPAVEEVQYEYQSWVITQLSLQMPSEPSDSPPRIQGTLSEHNVLPATHEWLHHSSTPWPPESDQKCIVSLFMSVTSAGKHQASLVIKHSDVSQHQGCPVLIHPLSFHLGGLDTPFMIINAWCCSLIEWVLTPQNGVGLQVKQHFKDKPREEKNPIYAINWFILEKPPENVTHSVVRWAWILHLNTTLVM